MKTGPQLLKNSLWVHFAAAAAHETWHFNLLVHCPHSCCLSGWVMELRDREKRGRLPAGKLTPLAARLCRSVESERREVFFSFAGQPALWCGNQSWRKNSKGALKIFERLDLWICACWRNAVGREQWPSVALLLSAALWCCHVWNGHRFS